jgi:hypothetical protein
VHYARLENEAGERLTLRCSGKKVELYVQPKAAAKKGTKIVGVRVDGGKPQKWKVKPSTDGKALFLDVKDATKAALDSAEKLQVDVPVGKKSAGSVFEVKGLKDALRALPKACRI